MASRCFGMGFRPMRGGIGHEGHLAAPYEGGSGISGGLSEPFIFIDLQGVCGDTGAVECMSGQGIGSNGGIAGGGKAGWELEIVASLHGEGSSG